MAPTMLPAIMIPLMAYAVWRRVRGNFGPQPIRRKRMIARIVIFTLVAGLLALSGLHNTKLLEGLLGGAVAGAALGLLGLRLTRFGQDANGADVYIPNPWIGAALTVLLVGRLAWRFLVAMPQMQDPAATYAGPPLGNSPLTLLVLGLMVGYYIAYCTGLLVHHRRFQREHALGTAD
ncbi:DUF1453 domain-containing protein [Dyella subtropica]|uniref:DUF1453 domain-containing protein n=1 Tax=Dyella subtropica TaxID=2992127 RepID=UPI0022541F36|nr:DUF1453 domain-containing protein [Dyella subtropica]